MIEERGPTSQAARARAEEQSYSNLVGVCGQVYVPRCPGRSTFRKDLLDFDKNLKAQTIAFFYVKTEVSGSFLRVFENCPIKLTRLLFTSTCAV